MIQALIELIETHPWALIVGSLFCLTGMWLAGRQIRAINTAQHIVEKGQFLPLSQAELDKAIAHAEREGNKEQFLNLLTKVRQAHGHDGLKTGHLYWIWALLEKGVLDPEVIPTFERESEENQ